MSPTVEIAVLAPMRGRVAPLASVPDPVFAQQMMGDGVAIHPLDDMVRAPFAGEVIALHEAGHAVSLRSDAGAELLIHVGLDTVALKGRGFTALVAAGDRVAAGDPLIRFDADAVAQAAPSLVTPVIVTNGDAFAIRHRAAGTLVAPGDILLTLERVGAVAPVEAATGETLSAEVALAFAHGIHARPAAQIGACARGFDADVTVINGERRGDARSTVSLLALGTRRGDLLRVEARGPDAEAALAAIAALLATDLDAGAPAPVARPSVAPAATTLAPGEIAGIVAAPGLAAGPAARIRQDDRPVERAGTGIDAERAALATAQAAVRTRLTERAATGGAAGGVMRAHLALLDDPALAAAAGAGIAAGDSAGFAWRSAIRVQVDMLRATGNAHLAERTDDLIDIERQVLAALAGEEEEQGAALPPDAIVLADDLFPSQLVTIAAAAPAGLCLARGGPTSHVAILCAGMGLPALVAIGAALDDIADGTALLLDAEAGRLTVDPAPDAADAFAARLADRNARRAAARAAADADCHTADGVRIEVFANAGSLDDAHDAAREGAEGLGLVRTEFLFLDRADPPGEDEQHAVYQGIAEAMGDRPVIVRLLDIGGDKPAAYLPIAAEENPALGLRGIRVGLAHPAITEAQVRAILRVAPAGQCRIMIPMVASVAEVQAVRAVVDRLRAELGIATPVEVGVMVETPAAAMTADLLADVADFLSIGSNDLTQYVLAMDRGNPAVAPGVDGLHPAVLRMVAETCRAAATRGRWIGLCGGLASDPAAIPILVGLGVTELSSVPSMVAEAKATVRALTMPAAREHAARALACTSAADVRALAADFAGGL